MVIYSGCVIMILTHNHQVGRRINPVLIYNSLATYLNNSKSTADIVIKILTSLAFCRIKGKKIPKIDKNN